MMEYKINLGSWNQVFAVPTEIVDKHLKLAGAAQLKVLLWFLRHAGEGFTLEQIASALSMQQADVRDCMVYWSETGVICQHESVMEPAMLPEQTAVPVQTDPAPEREASSPAVPKEPPKQPSRALSRPEKPDAKYLSQRIEQDQAVAFLMQSADDIFGRLTNMNDKATLLMIHETDGLPIEVIIMLLQYLASIGKCNIRYIEKMAITWADEEINTIESAEKKIQQLTSGRNAAAVVQKLFGLDTHSPTEKETEYADRWVNQWKFSTEMIRKAYEICVDAKGKYIPKYVDSVLKRWNSAGITTPDQADLDQIKGKKQTKTVYDPTYDLLEYESSSILDEE